MSLTKHDKQYIDGVALEVLEKIEQIAEAAKIEFQDSRTIPSNPLVNTNTWTSDQAMGNLKKIWHAKQKSSSALMKEPVIARVLVEDNEGERKIYYICRATPVSGIPNLASYNAPVGRLAAISVGDGLRLPNGMTVEVLGRAQLRPVFESDIWDSHNTVIETEHLSPVTIESLRALLSEVAPDELGEDILGQLLAEEGQKINIFKGMRRSVITKMGLRDQPILDQYQDEIFRLPLDMRLLILGPPGTGKTTTLVRRLGQKLDVIFLEEEEKSLVETISKSQSVDHADSWLMFTPTDLLQQYLKEAFARERVPASNQRIRTWHDYRRDLARNTFNVLKTAYGGGVFILKDNAQSLAADAITNSIKWFSDFDEWQLIFHVKELQHAATSIATEGQKQEVKALGRKLSSILDVADKSSLASCFEEFAREIPRVQSLITNIKDSTDAKIKKALNDQLNLNRSFLDELARYIDKLLAAQATDPEEQDDIEIDEDEDLLTARTGRATAINAYMQAVRTKARAIAAKRTLSSNTRSGKIIEWIGDRLITENELVEVGNKLMLLSKIRSFANTGKRYVDGIPKRYSAFRILRQKENTWYSKEGFGSKELHPLELDVVLLTILKAVSDLVKRPSVLRGVDESAWSWLKPYFALYRNQVLVDEATDFSPIQLSCMAALAYPKVRSFFACGDFNQRLTTWGTRTLDELKWVSSDIEIREITVSYRQSKHLNELARSIIQVLGGDAQSATLPERVDIEGVAPALLEYPSDESVVIGWLAKRICEIERFVEMLPSTAIFVNSENEIIPMAAALDEFLSEHNIRVIACPNGQVMGKDNDVRVFDIQHIKGLEFEAVFFVAIDRLASMQPELFDKYLYVGATRAATYLGVTCDDVLPPAIEELRQHFVRDWQG